MKIGVIAAAAALVLAGLAAMSGVKQAQAFPQIPSECSGYDNNIESVFEPDKIIYVHTAVAYIPDTGVLLIYGRPSASNNITAPWATKVCMIGGTKNDSLTGGRGDDVLIGNGSTSYRDYMNGMGGTDLCIGPGVLVSCEDQQPLP